MKPPVPPAERARLEALHRYEVLDTAAEAAFDDLAHLAAFVCGVPVAMVSLVDEHRQWFKARVGMPLAETPRDDAFCAHTILRTDDILEVEDATRDGRFADNPLVTAEQKIRFYAGAPLVNAAGHSLGALCVMDRQPRKLTPEQVAALRALSRQVVAQLELHRQAKELRAQQSETSRLLETADKSRRTLLSLLEDQRHVETALRSSEERFRQIAETIHEVFWMTNPSKNEILYVSPAYEAIWGRSRESLYVSPHSWSESIHPQERSRVLHAAASQQVTGDYDETYRIIRPDGTIRWVNDRAFPVRDEDGAVTRVVGVAEDVTERRAVELRVELQHAVTRILAEAAPLPQTARDVLEAVCRLQDWDVGGFWTIDRAAGVLRCVETWSPAPAKFQPFLDASRKAVFKNGEGLPGRVWHTVQSAWIPEVRRDAAFKRTQAAEEAGLRGAAAFPIHLRSDVFGIVEFYSHETRSPEPEILALFAALGAQLGQFIERQQLADQFRQAQKMEAIGTLAGGIAHDFNNVLAAISGFTELAKWEVPEDSPASEYLSSVLQGSKRATDLVRQILAFSRRQELERKPIQLQNVLGEALKLLRATIPATIEFDVSITDPVSTVMADATQIHQVVMNLCTNAAHAMRERSGRLTVRLDETHVEPDFAASLPGLRPGPHVVLSVGDTGCGMDEATMGRIFEPFFTTKAPGEGTGLGLSVVHGIMQSHDGAVAVTSRVGVGTTFRLYFPVHQSAEAPIAAKPGKIPHGSGERILLIDDETLLVTMGKRILEKLGYVVDGRTNAPAALKALRTQPGDYDLVITDYMMPTLTGTALAEQVRSIRRDLPVILMTGYSATLTAERAQAFGIQKLLMKPLAIETLATAVFQVLHPERP